MAAIPHKYRFRVNGVFCFLKTLWRSFNLATLESGISTSGHDFYEQPNGDLMCGICGAPSLSNDPDNEVVAEYRNY